MLYSLFRFNALTTRAASPFKKMNISHSIQFFAGGNKAVDRMMEIRKSKTELVNLANSKDARFVVSINGAKKFLFVNRNPSSLSSSEKSLDSTQQLMFFSNEKLFNQNLHIPNPYALTSKNGFSSVSFSESTEKKLVEEYKSAVQLPYSTSIILLGKIDPALLNLQEDHLPKQVYVWCIDLGDLDQFGKNILSEYFFIKDVDQDLDAQGTEKLIASQLGGVFLPLRAGSFGLDSPSAHLLAVAAALADWNYRSRFCPSCGHKLWSTQAGYKKVCAHGFEGPGSDQKPSLVFNEGSQLLCSSQLAINNYNFPRTDPVIIVGIIHPKGDRLLLARGTRFPGAMYSCIAGFVDAAESLEDAVKRESMEELGLVINRVEYVTSQPWPFPNNLMIG
ncbi:hypothetical protein BB560_005054, partial [Smittium megazygosporum]